MCPHSFCACVALRWADPPSKESYQLSLKIRSARLIMTGNRPQGLIRQCRRGRCRILMMPSFRAAVPRISLRRNPKTVTVLFLWVVLSDDRTGLSFVYAAGPRQRSLSWVRVPWDSLPYFTVTDFRLTFSPPPTTPRVTVEIFGPAYTRVFYCPAEHFINTENIAFCCQ
jgi:hypothetical protein